MISFFPSRTVALDLFGFEIHWYGLMYLFAFLFAWWLLPRLQKFRGLNLSSDDWAAILSAAVIGVIVGGRLGFVLFYQPGYFFAHPSQIIAVWRGGMSSHGGFIGVAVALLVVMRRRPWREILAIMDIVVVPVAIGLGLGRIGNLINQELYGTVTTLPWGMVIPGVEGMRHPTSIYAFLKDMLIAGMCFWYLYRTAKNFFPGRGLALFFVMYGVLRFLVEFVRVQDYSSLHVLMITLTRGQLLTIPVFVVGVILWIWTSRGKA